MTADTHKELVCLLRILRGEVPEFSDIDRPKFVYTLKFHRMISLVGDKIISGQIDYLEKQIKDEVLILQQAGLVLKSALRKALLETAHSLSSAEIPFIVIKGFHLSENIYPGYEARLFSDNDILVGREDFGRAAKILQDAGYIIMQGLHSRFSVEQCAKLGISRPYHHSEAGFLQIDLHSRLSINPGLIYLDDEDCWENTNVMDLDGTSLTVLPSAVNRAYLSWHSLKHSVSRIVWFRDLYLYMKKEPGVLEQVKFFELLDRYRLRKMTASVLLTAAKIFNDNELSATVEKIFSGARRLDQKYFAPEKLLTVRDEISPLDRTLRDLRIIEKNVDRLSYLWRSFFPEPDLLPELKSKTGLNFNYLANRIQALSKAVMSIRNN